VCVWYMLITHAQRYDCYIFLLLFLPFLAVFFSLLQIFPGAAMAECC
jgi:hypothetical protein